MTTLPSGIATSGANISATNLSHIGKFVGLDKHFSTRQRFIDAVTSAVTAQYSDGEKMTVADEAAVPVVHLWFKTLGHARTIQIGTWRHVLPSYQNRVWATSGMPSLPDAIEEDIAVDLEEGFVYQLFDSNWTLLRALGGGGGELPDAPVNTVAPTFTGDPISGGELTLGTGAWTGDPTTFRYQITLGGVPVDHRNNKITLAADGSDVGKEIGGTVVASNGRLSEPASAVAVVVKPPRPVPTNVRPTLSGPMKQGGIMTITPGEYTHQPTSYRRVLKRADVVIDGAVSADTYGYVAADVGQVLVVEEYASNAGGESLVPNISLATPVIAAADAQPTMDVPTSTSQLWEEYAVALPTHTYSFGANAQAIPALEKAEVINSLAAVEAAFKSHQDFTGTTKINSEAQTYVPIGSDGVHVIGADRLELWAKLQEGEDWTVPFDAQVNSSLPTYLNGTVTPWANLPNTTSPVFPLRAAMMTAEVGQWVPMLNRGVARITAIDPGVSVTVVPVSPNSTNGTGNFVNAIMGLLPVHSALCSTYTQGTTTLTFPANSLSSKIRPGWSVGRVSESDTTKLIQMTGDVRVVSIDRAAGILVVNRSIPYNDIPGSRMVFWPRIAAAQIWTRKLFDIRPEMSRLALEWDVDIAPGFSTAAAADLPRDGNRFNLYIAQRDYPEIPAGLWAALWGVAGNDGSGASAGPSEPDFLELFVDCTKGLRAYMSGNVHDTSQGANPEIQLFNRADSGWVYTNSVNRLSAVDGASLVGRHKFRSVYGWELTDPALPFDASTNPYRACTWRYLDGLLIKKETWRYTSGLPLQLAMNSAMGWLSRSGTANFQFPMKPSNFARAHMDILSLKVWCRTGA